VCSYTALVNARSELCCTVQCIVLCFVDCIVFVFCEGNKGENCGGPWLEEVYTVSCDKTTIPGEVRYGFLWNMPSYGSVCCGFGVCARVHLCMHTI